MNTMVKIEIEWKYCPETKELILKIKNVGPKKFSKILNMLSMNIKKEDVIEGEYDLTSTQPSFFMLCSCFECSKAPRAKKKENEVNKMSEDEKTCFQCGQKGVRTKAVWKAFGWAVTYGIPGTTYHCEKHKPYFTPKITVDNRDLKKVFKIERI